MNQLMAGGAPPCDSPWPSVQYLKEAKPSGKMPTSGSGDPMTLLN